MCGIMAVFSFVNTDNTAYAATATRGNFGSITLAQDAYDESSDSGGSWGEGDHTSYDGHIRFTYHNAASFFGYDLTSWTKGRVSDIVGTLKNSVGDATFRFTVYMTDKVSQVSNHGTWGKGTVYFDLYKNGTHQRSASVACDMSNTNTKFNDLYLGVLSYGVPYRIDVALKFACDDGSSWANYQGSWSYYFTIEKRTDYNPGISSGYVLRNNTYYFKNNFWVYWSEGYNGYRVNNIIYAMPSVNAYRNGNSYTSYATVSTEGTHNFNLYDWYDVSIASYKAVLDKSAPTNYIYDTDNNVISGSTNKAFYYSPTDSVSGVDYCQYKTPTSGDWENYKAGTVIPATATDGTYQFRAYDIAGNVSSTSIVLDTVIPTLSIKDDNNTVVNNKSRVNADSLTFSASDDRSGIKSLYLKMPNSSTFTSFSGSKTVTDEGTYSFYAIDYAGNISETKVITIDKSPPVLTCNDTQFYTTYGKGFTVKVSDNGGKDVQFYYKRPNDSEYSLVNGNECIIDDFCENGIYYFYAIDDVGNCSDEYWIELKIEMPIFTVHWNEDNTFYIDWTGNDYVLTVNGNNYTKNSIISGEGTYTAVATNIYGFSTTNEIVITHKYVVTSTTEPSCLTQGFSLYECISCGNVVRDDIVEATGHNYSTEVIESTCDEQGYTIFTCITCGYSHNDNYTDVLSHNYKTQVVSPTCTSQGYTIYTCTLCNYTKTTDYVGVVPHDYSVVVTYPTCTEKGYSTFTCKNCTNSYVSNYVNERGHSYIAEITEPTCTERGYSTFTCSACFNSYVGDYVSATGHSLVSIETQPTCTEKGFTVNTCSNCDFSSITNYVLPTGHSLETETIKPTCTENGCTRYSCRNCAYYYDTDTVVATGHTYSQITIDPTCTENGGVKNYCTVCDYYYMSEEILATGHEYETKVAKPATCKSVGVRRFSCIRCSDYYTTEIPIIQHKYEMTSTETTDGIVKRTYECIYCNDNYIQEMGEQYDKVASYVEYLFQQYAPYMIWVFVGTSGIWSIVMGIFIIIANKNDEKEKARKMLKNYFIGMIAIFVILMAAPLLVRGIAALVT